MAIKTVAFLALLLACSVSAANYRLLGTFKMTNPAFLYLYDPSTLQDPNDNTTNTERGKTELVISTFTGSPFETGTVQIVPDISSKLNDIPKITPQKIASGFQWPNEVIPVPPSVIPDHKNKFTVPDGFLVPGKDNGGVFVLNAETGEKVRITKEKSGWFYHQLEWVRDIDGDGRADLLTCRANKPMFGSGKGELVWLKQPNSNNLFVGEWEEVVLAEGPDVFLHAVELDGNPDTLELITPQFFTKKLTLHVINLKKGTVEFVRDIDTKIGAAYQATLVDVNGDGKLDILATNHEEKPENNGMFAYEIPSNIYEGEFVKHVLAKGFPVTQPGFNQAAPGFSYAFEPASSTGKPKAGSRPHILVAGDGSQSAHLFTPVGNSGWEYEEEVVIKTDGTVGSITFGDINQDGYVEFFVPNYDKGQVHIFSFSEKVEIAREA